MQGLTVVALAALALSSLAVLVSRFLRLRHIPGPRLAAVTDLWAATKTWRGERYHNFIRDLHIQYGPVVRWGPNRVSFSQPEAIPAIYGTKDVFPKSASYNPLTVMSNGQEIPTLITIRDERRFTDVKKHIAAGFSQSTWLGQETQVDSTISHLIARLREKTPTDVVQMDQWMRYWQSDTLTKLAFSESRGFLAAGADVDGLFPSSKARFEHWQQWAAMPSLEAFLFKNPIVQKFQKSTGALAKLAMQQIQLRQSGEKQATGNDLLGRYLAASQTAPNVFSKREVLALTISTIHAGSETTAMTSLSMLAHLLRNPNAHMKLENELTGAGLSVPAPFHDVEKLPYLDAVMRETMRLSINPNCTERTITSEGASICDTWLPAGTDVSIAELLIARDPAVFGSDTDSFRPERWLEAGEKQWREMDRASFGFSYGRRVCIGQHLARIEMKKVVASLITAFKFTLVDGSPQGVAEVTRGAELDVHIQPRI